MALDCTKFSKTALKAMLDDQAFSAHHADIKAFLTPAPKDFTPVEKETWRANKSSMSASVYLAKGYTRLETNRGNGVLYLEAATEIRDYLDSLIKGGKLKNYRS
jgi:hypothetical protein